MVPAALAIAVITGLSALLFVIVHFAIISPMKTEGAKDRLRSPESAGIADICGFSPPLELIAFYRQAPLVDFMEFHLVDRSRVPAAIWSIGAFVPLTPVDIRERRKLTRVDGIPIADDLDKGAYYVTRAGTVRLWSPNAPSNDVEVASSITAFVNFEVRHEWPEEAEAGREA